MKFFKRNTNSSRKRRNNNKPTKILIKYFEIHIFPPTYFFLFEVFFSVFVDLFILQFNFNYEFYSSYFKPSTLLMQHTEIENYVRIQLFPIFIEALKRFLAFTCQNFVLKGNGETF